MTGCPTFGDKLTMTGALRVVELVSPQVVRGLLMTRREIAILDLREEARFASGHPLFAAHLPLSRLELEIFDRVPRRETLIVLYDNEEGLVGLASRRLRALGYTNVRGLDRDMSGWKEAGYEVFQDVNSYSKAFGEFVEHHRQTPSLSAQEVKALLDGGGRVALLDARPFDEYQAMSVPTAVNVPGAELVLRARDVAPDPTTPIIVNCAGRTRSLIGAQSLLNAGVPNPVAALRNGTIGWVLAEQELDRGQARTYPPLSADTAADAGVRARAVSYRAGVRRLQLDELAELATDAARTLYRFDVRSGSEYAAGHIAGFRSAPGGQLVQEIDVFAPVRGARIVVFDDIGARADMTASWLAQLAWEVYVLDAPASACEERGAWRPNRPVPCAVVQLDASQLAGRLSSQEVVVVDLATSRAYERGHIPGAWFAIRSRLAQAIERLPPGKPLVFTSPDGALAQLAAADVESMASVDIAVLKGGTASWLAEGRGLATGLERAADQVDDVYRRPYEGLGHSSTAMQAYLDWEYGLVEQLRRDGTHGFYVV
jgi:rhodanese-related sulfurtransferase